MTQLGRPPAASRFAAEPAGPGRSWLPRKPRGRKHGSVKEYRLGCRCGPCCRAHDDQADDELADEWLRSRARDGKAVKPGRSSHKGRR